MSPVIALFDIVWGLCQAGIALFVIGNALEMHHMRFAHRVSLIVLAVIILVTSPVLYYVDLVRHTGALQ